MWAFYRDASGYWRWEHRDEEASHAFESHAGFATRDACFEDAADHGYEEESFDEPAPLE